MASINDTTYYRCVTTCTASTQSSISSSVTVNFNPLINCYCMPNYNITCSNGNKVNTISFANLTSQTITCDPSGFTDYTSSAPATINLTAANSYILSANIASTATFSNSTTGVWIDFNQNAIFEASEFTSLGFGMAGTYSTSIFVPITSAGVVRMRLKLEANYATASTYLDGCINNNGSLEGQILDYKVNITAAPACSGAPNAGNATSTETIVCKNVSYTLDLSNNSISSNITYQWQSSLNGTTWTNLGLVQNTIPYSVNSQSVTTYYRCITTCTTSAPISATSTPVVVNQNLPTACYCDPQSI